MWSFMSMYDPIYYYDCLHKILYYPILSYMTIYDQIYFLYERIWTYEVCPKSIRPAFRLFFSIMRVLCTTNLLQEVRRSTKNITLKFWKDCVLPWEENDRVSGQAVTGFFTTITRQRIHRTLCSNFWRNTKSASVQSRHSSLRLLDVPKIENGAQRKAVRRHRDDSE